MNDSSEAPPWYRQIWPWILIAIPASSVIGGVLMLYVVMTHPDDLVRDDYYREGMGINRDLRRDSVAAELGIQAQLRIDSGNGHVAIKLEGLEENGLILALSHPVDQERDLVGRAVHDNMSASDFNIHFARPLDGRWYAELRNSDDDWRLRATITLPASSIILMQPSSR